MVVDGRRHLARLTLGALAGLEAELGEPSLVALVERFEAGRFSARDVLALLAAGLGAAGWEGEPAALAGAEIGDGQSAGPVVAARLAAELLARAFALPEGGGDG